MISRRRRRPLTFASDDAKESHRHRRSSSVNGDYCPWRQAAESYWNDDASDAGGDGQSEGPYAAVVVVAVVQVRNSNVHHLHRFAAASSQPWDPLAGRNTGAVLDTGGADCNDSRTVLDRMVE